MLPARVREHARRILVDQFDVGDERNTGMQTFEQVVREQCVLRDGVRERGRERIDGVQALPREDAFAEYVLIGVRHRRRIGIDAGMARIESREQRSGGAREGYAYARLENAVPRRDTTERRIEERAIERMRDHADQLARGVARKTGVAVQCDAVLYMRQNRAV